MKKILLCISYSIFSFAMYGQQVNLTALDTIAVKVNAYRDKVKVDVQKDLDNDDYFSYDAYDRYFDKFFTLIKYERENFTEGNSAALSIADSKTRLNLNLSHKSQNFIFSVGTALNISDNSGIIFSGDRPTAGTEFFTSFSFLVPQWRKIGYSGKFQEINFKKRLDLADSLWILHSRKNPIIARRLLDEQMKLESQFRYYDTMEVLMSSEAVNPYKDSLLAVIDKLTKNKNELKRLESEQAYPSEAAASIIRTARQIAVNKELETSGVTTTRMVWLSGGVGYRKDNYQTYDRALIFSKRTDEKNFDKWTLNGSLNFFWQRSDYWINFRKKPWYNSWYNSIYMNINYSLSRTNTFDKLKEQTLGIITTSEQNDTTYEFNNSKKVREISGKTFEHKWLHKPGVVITTLLGKKQYWGLNIRGTTELQDKELPVFNLQTGFLFRFRNSENEKSLVNFELFFAFNDMTDTKGQGKSVWQQKQVGISANVPFQKVFFR